MTRISLVDLEQGSKDHCIIVMEQAEEKRIRDRSRDSDARQSPSKRVYSGESLMFETRMVDCEGEEQTFGAIGIVNEDANKLSWRQFKNYMIRNGGIEKIASRKNEVKIFYIDDEDDEIFVDTDDEYRELIKIASAKNKSGEWMVLKFLSVSKTRRNLETRRRSCGDRKIDLLGREMKASPGKVMKHPSKHFDTVSGKMWKINGGKNMTRGKVPGKVSPIFGPPQASKPVTIADGLSEVKELSRSLEESRISPNRRIAKSPESHEMLKQQASVFDWMSKNSGPEEKDAPPTWFVDYMENYKDEVAAEITAKVVHSLGIIIDNKLAGLVDRKSDPKVDETDFAKKVRKDKVKVKKVKSEAMRMSMDLGEEAKESKEMKKLKKSLIKKTDKVVKVAMKIEKKNQQEHKSRKTSISSSNNSDIQGIKLSEKKEKKNTKTKEEKKVKKTKGKKEEGTDDEVNYPVSLVQNYPITPTRNYPITAVVDYPIVLSPDQNRRSSVVTSQPRYSSGIVERLASRQLFGSHTKIEIPSREDVKTTSVALSPENNLIRRVEPEEKFSVTVFFKNTGSTKWQDGISLRRAFSTGNMEYLPKSEMEVPQCNPGDEKLVKFWMKSPQAPGNYESLWHFYKENDQFGPLIEIKVEVVPKPEILVNPPILPEVTLISLADPLVPPGVELKDYSATQGQEMRSIGISAMSQEMVEMSRVKKTTEEDDLNKIVSVNIANTEEGFDLLANEVDALTLSSQESEDDDFEVIPVPDCFNLEVPFEVVEEEVNNNNNEEEDDLVDENSQDEESQDEETGKSSLEDAISAVQVVQDKLKLSSCILDIEKEITSSLKTEALFFLEMEKEESKVSSTLEKFSEEAQEAKSVNRLVEMGFANRAENIKLLRQNNNNIDKVLKQLFSTHGTDWAENRH